MKFDLIQGRLGNHRLHPMLVHFPVGLYPFSFATDLIGVVSQNNDFFNASIYALYGAVGTSVPAMIYGVIDFLKIETNSKAWKRAGWHALLNLLWFMIFCSLLFYRVRHHDVGTLYLVIIGLTTGGMFFSNYLGADLIISHRIGIDSQPARKSGDK